MDNKFNTAVIKGSLDIVSIPLQVSESFVKREVVVHVSHPTNERYDEYIPIEFTQDKCSLLDGYKVGDEVQISVDVSGRRWRRNDDDDYRYFGSNKGWRIERVGQAPASAPAMPADEGDDLPF